MSSLPLHPYFHALYLSPLPFSFARITISAISNGGESVGNCKRRDEEASQACYSPI